MPIQAEVFRQGVQLGFALVNELAEERPDNNNRSLKASEKTVIFIAEQRQVYCLSCLVKRKHEQPNTFIESIHCLMCKQVCSF